MKRIVLLGLLILALNACEQHQAKVIEKPVYLYGTADDCHGSAHAGPEDTIRGTILRGVIATLDVGMELTVVGEDIRKEFACFEVRSAGGRGYVLASGRIIVER